MKPAQRLAASAAFLALILGGPGLTTVSAQYRVSGARIERGRILEGDRFDTLRGLAQYVDAGTQFTLERATDRVGYTRGGNERALVNALQKFARRTDDLNRRVEQYQSDPGALDREVRSLFDEGRRLDSRMHRVGEMRGLYDDWAAVLGGLDRMQRFMAGDDVRVPPVRREWADRGPAGRYGNGRYSDTGRSGERRQSDVGGFRTGLLTGRDMDDFYALTQDLDTRAQHMLDLAERNRPSGDDPRTEELMSGLRRLATRARDLRDRARDYRVDPAAVGPIIERGLEDARATDRGLREANALPNVWNEWQGAIGVLERMDAIVRR